MPLHISHLFDEQGESGGLAVGTELAGLCPQRITKRPLLTRERFERPLLVDGQHVQGGARRILGFLACCNDSLLQGRPQRGFERCHLLVLTSMG